MPPRGFTGFPMENEDIHIGDLAVPKPLADYFNFYVEGCVPSF